MVCFRDSVVAVCKSTNMANSWNSAQTHPIHRNRRQPNLPKSSQSINLPFCEQSRTGVIDVLYSIAVVSALGYLIFPYIKLFFNGIMTIGGAAFVIVKDEVYRAPVVYICIGFSLFFAVTASLLVFICMDNKCGNPNCRGLRKAPEFDIQIEEEDSVKDSTSYGIEGGGREMFNLSPDYSRELEAELKKFAPPNGKAILVFRAKCGCAVGKMEVPGSKKLLRKIKK